MFGVSVDAANRFISVLPTDTTNSAFPSFHPTAGPAFKAINQITGLSVSSTSLHRSVRSATPLYPIPTTTNSNTTSPYHQTAFDATADSFLRNAPAPLSGSGRYFVEPRYADCTERRVDYSAVETRPLELFQAVPVRLGEARYVGGNVWGWMGLVLLWPRVAIEAPGNGVTRRDGLGGLWSR